MIKLLSPYTQNYFLGKDRLCFGRRQLNSTILYTVWKSSIAEGYWYRSKAGDSSIFFHSPFLTKKDAMESMDNYLILLGYTFLTEEQWEKYSLLL